jgi:hypothetical protein
MGKRAMTQRKAVKVAVAAIKAQIQRVAVDANIYEAMGQLYPSGKLAFERRQELREAINLLEGKE